MIIELAVAALFYGIPISIFIIMVRKLAIEASDYSKKNKYADMVKEYMDIISVKPEYQSAVEEFTKYIEATFIHQDSIVPMDVFPGTMFKYVIRANGIALCQGERQTLVFDFDKIGLKLTNPDMIVERFVSDLRKSTAEYIEYISIYADSELDTKTGRANGNFIIYLENVLKEY